MIVQIMVLVHIPCTIQKQRRDGEREREGRARDRDRGQKDDNEKICINTYKYIHKIHVLRDQQHASLLFNFQTEIKHKLNEIQRK